MGTFIKQTYALDLLLYLNQSPYILQKYDTLPSKIGIPNSLAYSLFKKFIKKGILVLIVGRNNLRYIGLSKQGRLFSKKLQEFYELDS